MKSLAVLLLFASTAFAQSYSTTVGTVRVGNVAAGTYELPVLTWGGDVPMLTANGGVTTQPNSLFAKNGLSLKITNGDDFAQQVRNYMSGKTPFLRGTLSMVYQACEVLNSDPRTKPIMVVQYTWSLGDHLVGREGTPTLNSLKGKTVCLQAGGPHIQLVDDALKAANLTWDDVKIKWATALTGKDSPAELFRNDPTIDLCCVISPDMLGLTGGIDQTGSGAEGTVKGARVVVSTASMSRSIADVLCVRSDFFSAQRVTVEKVVAGYLKSTEDLLAAKKTYDDGKGQSPEYLNALRLAQQFYGATVLPTLEVDAHGLVSDAAFVGLPGNVSFFLDPENLSGFEPRQAAALELASKLGFVTTKINCQTAQWDYQALAKIAGVEYTAPKIAQRIRAEGVEVFPDDELDDRTMVSFTIQFEPNQQGFDLNIYGAEFRRVIENASTFGNSVVVIRGHADPTLTIVDLLKAGMANGAITRTGSKEAGYSYQIQGRPLNLSETPALCKLIQEGQFATGEVNPLQTMQAALNLSQVRAEQVKQGVAEYAKTNKLKIDMSQIQPVGVGIREPVISKPANIAEARKNMRVEFRLIRVSAEALEPSDFDF